MTNNPYQAPTSDVVNQNEAPTYQPKIFSTKGRIGRLRYLAYLLVTYLFMVPGGLLIAISGGLSAGIEEPPLLFSISRILLAIGYIAMLVYYFILSKRRFNDMDKSGWMSLLLVIPLVNLFVTLWLVFGGGKLQPNQFGPAPCENSLAVKVFGLLGPILVIVGILAAVSVPAYQNYVERANSAQESFGQK